MRRSVLLSIAATVAATPIPAMAGLKAYPHKAGATAEAVNAEQTECFQAAQVAMKNPSAPNPYNPVTQSTAAGAAGAALATGFARGIEQGRVYKLTYLNCMESKGYTQRALPSAEWKVIKKMSPDERKDRLGALMTAPQPMHSEMPRDEMD